MLLSCTAPQTEVEIVPNPMPVIWEAVRNDLIQLEKIGAPPAQWAQKAEQSEVIRNQRQLAVVTEHLNLSGAEKAALLRHYQGAAETIHYGFEGNYHALVFFTDKSFPDHVLRW